MSDYEVVEKYLKEGDFAVLILKTPVDEIEDKLEYLAEEKGQIANSYYGDFIIATCVTNIKQLLYHLNQQIEDPSDVIKLREELVALIIEINPSLDPNNLIINRNSVIKIKKDGDLEDGEKLLTDNKYWELSCYEDINKTKDDSDKDDELTTINKIVKSFKK
jgi:hypothetical protein